MESKKNKIISVVLFIIGTELVGYLSSLLAGNIGNVYTQLTKPPLSPPGQVFGIVWPILYALMGLAMGLIFNREDHLAKQALAWYLIQLGLNFMWSIIFFRFEARWLALVVLILLDIAVLYLLTLFYRINKVSFALLLPYLIWILFATYLNIGFAFLN